MPRMFIAVWPPAEVGDALDALPRGTGSGVRWTTRAQWHVTLRFFGEVDEVAALEVLRSVRAEPVVAVVGPRVGWLGAAVLVVPVAGLDPLAAAVRAVDPSLGEPADPRSFAGHITVGRRRRGSTEPVPLEGCAMGASFRVDDIALIRSELTPAGARYHTVATHRLSS